MISLSRVFHVVQRAVGVIAVGGVVAMASASTLEAQGFELVGARARGMGGAFVAVADDASATWFSMALPTSPRSIPSPIGRLKTRAAPGRTGHC
jgi:hypothetical protein